MCGVSAQVGGTPLAPGLTNLMLGAYIPAHTAGFSTGCSDAAGQSEFCVSDRRGRNSLT